MEIDSQNSSHKQIMCGVPQGSILGPLLYLLYVNDIHISCESSILSFADDTTLHISDHNLVSLFENANKEINKLYKWFCANKLSLNANTTKHVFSPQNHDTDCLTPHATARCATIVAQTPMVARGSQATRAHLL